MRRLEGVITEAVRPLQAVVDLEGLFRAHATGLLRLAVLLTSDRAIAEELVQETFLRVRRQSTPPTVGSELAYLRRTLVNLSHSHHRHLRVVRSVSPDRQPSGPGADVEVVQRDGRRLVLEAIRQLPRRQRDCVVLRYYSDLSDAEIGSTLGISTGSVKTHLHRARAALAGPLEGLR